MNFDAFPIAIQWAHPIESLRHNERTTLRGRGNFWDSSGKWMGRGQKGALEYGEHVYLIL